MNITLGELELDKSLYRGLLQWWGTEYRRSQDKDYWIKKWLESLARVPVSTTRLIIAPDVRFANEYHTIKQLGGYLFRVKRPVKSVENHLSECTLDEVPMAIIDNSKDLEYTKQQVINIIKRMKLI